ncbi:MAG: nuclear transport factor 2 family protein [Actinomycetota bacterium]
MQFTLDRLIAEDDLVVLEARGKATTRAGQPYENRYCVVFRIVDGALQEITELRGH